MLYGKFNKDATGSDGYLFDEIELRKKLEEDNITLPEGLNDVILSSFGYFEVGILNDDHGLVSDSTNIIMYSATIEEIGGVPKGVRQAELVSYGTEEQIIQRRARKLKELRDDRDKALQATDFTQLEDVDPAVKAEYAIIRSQLRNLFDGAIDPFLIRFPYVPEINKASEAKKERGLVVAMLKKHAGLSCSSCTSNDKNNIMKYVEFGEIVTIIGDYGDMDVGMKVYEAVGATFPKTVAEIVNLHIIAGTKFNSELQEFIVG